MIQHGSEYSRVYKFWTARNSRTVFCVQSDSLPTVKMSEYSSVTGKNSEANAKGK